MSIKSTIVTAATALTLISGLGAAGTLAANAATPQCGSSCTELYSRAFGPAFIPGVLHQASRIGQPAILASASRADKGEDFRVEGLGRVAGLYDAGLISGGLNALYGNLLGYEIEYTPHGSSTDLCLGTVATPGAGTPVALERCGVNANTIWILAPTRTGTGTFFALISGATRHNFRHPCSLTTPAPGRQLLTAPLAANARGALLAHQLWRAKPGVLPGS